MVEEDNKYNHQAIEPKWQKRWEESGLYWAEDNSHKPKFYCLIEFPYPSADGLHVGHPRSYTALDILARKRRMEGYNVLFPIGFDAFGLPTENYAIKVKKNPAEITKTNIDRFRRQLKSLGLSFDWSREVTTCDPEYYKWTQWIFLKLYEAGLVYQKELPINWCPSCKIGLANEEVVSGKCERCGTPVTKKNLKQWLFKITQYAQRLIDDLDKVDYLDKIKTQQINWISRSEGALIKFQISSTKSQINTKSQILNSKHSVEVFTTRPDTLFGATYLVLSPEHELIKNKELGIKNYDEVMEYIEKAKKKSDLERTDLAKEKTGVELKGIKAINPATKKEIPVWVADYVLTGYGTGAIMAVPAHDERDWEFAKKFNLPIIMTIAIDNASDNLTKEIFEFAKKISILADKKNKKFIFDGGFGLDIAYGKITRNHGDIDAQVEKDDLEFWKEYFVKEGFEIKKNPDERFELYIADNGKFHIDFGCYRGKFIKNSIKGTEFTAFSPKEILNFKKSECKRLGTKRLKDVHDFTLFNEMAYIGDGFLINSGIYDGLTSEEGIKQITKWLEKEKLGKPAVNYKLRDWVFSRQHYWGEPIPLIHCDKCGIVPVPEKVLPVTLPTVRNYEPTDTGESPLAAIKDWVNVQCPKCGGKAKRETDTMPNWAGSNWYFIRYTDPHSNQAFASSKKMKHWLPVDIYNGGMEHTTLHLLYSRFWYKALYDLKLVPGSEPYSKRVSHGMVLAEDGKKMSKSLGNVINPDDVVKEYGADTLRMYEMFMGPFSEAIPWDTKGIVGVRRFLDRVYRLGARGNEHGAMSTGPKAQDSGLKVLLNKTIKKVTEDIENFRFNTAVSALMVLVNEMEKQKQLPITHYQLLITLLSPFAPHLSEELWEKLGHKESIFKEKWPQYDPNLAKESEIEFVIQVNGKVRDRMQLPADISEKEAIKKAEQSEKIKKYLDRRQVVKKIFVKGKLLNIVVK
ncbi:MAG: hypothetical protein COY66_01460 [Candidatus Kerfeldbacteria bacterium CG_4_10_14_0_8_um_filter_42_10]|uniref:Leucine--tRNA ligase n=1 Tax=Candidatus Kerfeldbacteria bacterium CG_4_10_14_0_8_um_filter_42_10 TaxID=2014248 RepID=A0A2M7RJW2_9BACT|nr:MAG: hypothetical protein COY66_01460 [Candidatus Kerfeldbacteria bacterium CG_4_10_14_0_8_um_filter_42_10]